MEERSRHEDRRWPWYGQVRDAAAAVAGFTILGVETFRGTYNPTAMVVVLALLGVVASGVILRWLTGKWNGNEKR